MTIETEHGYKIPELEDKDFWDSYNFNIARYDGHTHTGVDSALVPPQATLDPAVATGIAHPAGFDGEMRYKIVSNEVQLFIYSPGETDWKRTSVFDDISPMTTGGDIIYGAAGGAGTRLANGSAAEVLTSAGGTSPPTWEVPEVGDVVGPASATDNALARFDSTTGELIQNGNITEDDSGNLAGVGTLNTHTIQGGTGTLALTSDITGVNSGTNTGDQTFDDTNPMTTGGDLIYGAASGAGTRLPNGVAGQILVSQGTTQPPAWQSTGPGTGDVVGPGGATDNALARFDATTGKLLQDGTVTQDDSGNLAAVGTLNTHTIQGGTGTLALTSDITGTNSGTNTGDELAASPTVAGVAELATIAEIDTGTDTVRTITPAGLAGSQNQTDTDANTTANAGTATVHSDIDAADITNLGNLSGINTGDVDFDDLSPMTTRADMIVRNASNVTARLAKGLAGQVLGMGDAGDDIGWVTTAGATTWISGGVLSINADPTKYDVAAGTGEIYDPITGVKTPVSWAQKTLVAPANIATEPLTHVLIDVSENIFETNATPTNEEVRTNIDLGTVVHLDGVNIIIATPRPGYTVGPGVQLQDLYKAIGNINLSGNDYSSAGSVLTLNKSAGLVEGFGLNTANLKAPNTKVTAADTPLTWFYNYETAGVFTIVSAVTDIDPENYNDPALGLVAVGNNKFQTQRFFYDGGSDSTVLQYGQAQYNSIAEAEAALDTEQFNKNPDLENFPLRGYLIVKKGTTDLTVGANAKFIKGLKIDLGAGSGGGASTSTTTLQQAYNNSPVPQTVLDSTSGGMEIEDASSPIGGDLFKVSSNGGGSKFLGVDVSGIAVVGNIAVTGLVDGVDVGAAVPANTSANSGSVTVHSDINSQHVTDLNNLSGVNTGDQDIDDVTPQTTKGDLIAFSTVAARLGVGANGLALVADSGETTGLKWGAVGSSGGGKNYVLNPDATSDATSNVAETSSAGDFGVVRTITGSELPEEYKGTAFKIAPDASIVLDDTVEFGIESTKIADADGGRIGTAECKILELAGSDISDGSYRIQVWDVTNSIYVGDSDTITGTGYYYLDVPLTAATDYEFHLIANKTDPDDISISGITISPVSKTTASFDTEEVSDTTFFDFTTLGTVSVIQINWSRKGNRLIAEGVCGMTGSATVPSYFKLTGGLTVDTDIVSGNISYLGTMGRIEDSGTQTPTYDDGETAVLFYDGTDADRIYIGPNTHNSIFQKDALMNGGNRFWWHVSIPIAQWAGFGSLPTVSAVQFENAIALMTYDSGNSLSAGLNNMQIDDAPTLSGFTFAAGTSNVLTPLFTGRVQISAGYSIVNHRRELRLEVTDGTATKKILQFSGQTSGDTAAETNRMSGACAFNVTAGVPLTFKSFVTSSTTTSGTPGDDLFIDVVRIPDYTARTAGIPIATSTELGLVKKNRYIHMQDTVTYSATATGKLILDAVPAGTYKVTVGARAIGADPDDQAVIRPQLNTSNISVLDGNWLIGADTSGSISGEVSMNVGYTSTLTIVFPTADIAGVGQNRFELDIDVITVGLVIDPFYILEKLENVELVLEADWTA